MARKKKNNEEVQDSNIEKNQDVQEVVLPKKSDLLKEQVELENQYNDLSTTYLEKVYPIKIGNKSNVSKLIRFVEHDAEFDHSTATGITILYNNLKNEKDSIKGKEWDGVFKLRTASCLILWKTLMSYKGKGFFEAKEFLNMVQLVGPELSEAVKLIDADNLALRGYHSRLNEIDTILESGKYETDITEEEEKDILSKSKFLIKQEKAIEDEVNPQLS